MSISAALSSALSGLTASSRMASVTSNNIANSMTEGYGPRDVELSARSIGGGVNVDGITRRANPALVAERRDIGSEHANADTLSTYHSRIDKTFGTPEDSYSLAALYAKFETSLVEASSRPDLPERLGSLLDSAQDIAREFGRVQETIQTLREEADAEIHSGIERANQLLSRVSELNTSIVSARAQGADTSGLLDQRQSAVDELSEFIPLKSAPRDGGAIALYTPGGTTLVDGPAAELGFQRTQTITAHQTLAAGDLSGLTVNDRAVDTGPQGPLAGGRLSALFEIRDDLAVQSQARLDSAARDLVERFQDPGLDATRAAGAAGLFTDGAGAFAAADEEGLAGRISVNALVDPDQGGATWRLRDGLGAAAPGNVGEAGLLQDMLGAMRDRRSQSLADLGTASITASGVAASLQSLAGNDRRLAEDTVSFTAARHSEVEERFLAEGVDTDQEMQRLMRIEQAYAANARMVRTIDEMMDTLLRI